MELRPAFAGSLAEPPPKLGSVTMLPPWTEMPAVLGTPVRLPVPAPPGPGMGEVPALAVELAPGPLPDFALPAPLPSCAAPEPAPVVFPAPPPVPPIPAVAPPVGDIAKAPREPMSGTPTVVPGLLEMMAAEFWLFPPEFPGDAVGAPASNGSPVPLPVRPMPRPEVWLDKLGGGGTTLALAMLGTFRPVTFPRLACTGGGTTSCVGRAGTWPAMRETSRASEGGGATTLGAGIDSLAVDMVSRCGDETGGGTTSVRICGKRACGSSRGTLAGGGGTTLIVTAGFFRISSRLISGGGGTAVALRVRFL